MKLFYTLATALSLAVNSLAAQSFAGSNLFYAAGLSSSQQDTLFSGLRDSGVKVLRVWLDGQSGTRKGTPISGYASLEPNGPGKSSGWDDTVLNRYDDFMHKAKSYGIKLHISIHSYNALSADPPDFYGKYYGTGNFYTDSNAISQFRDRIYHVLYHVNPNNGKRWADSPEYIFGFEAQNEAMHPHNNPDALVKWECTMAQTIRDAMGGKSDILTSTGGGSYVDTSLTSGLFTCSALDVLAIHAYGVGDYDKSKLDRYVSMAKNNGKRLIMQEWGACYYKTANNRCNNDGNGGLDSGTRDDNIRKWANTISSAGIPWFYWQILPNADPHEDWDYEIGIDDVNYDTFKSVALGTSGYTSQFDFTRWLP